MTNNFYSPLEIAQKIAHGSAILKGRSPTDIGKALRVEPNVLVDERLMHIAELGSVMSTTLDYFACYYGQALNVLLNVNAIEVMRRIEALNPNRDMADAFIGLGTDYINKPATENLALQSYRSGPSLENFQTNLESNTINGGAEVSTKDIRDAAALAVGKIIGVKYSNRGATIDASGKPVDKDVGEGSLFITIRLIPAPTNSNTIVDILSIGAEDNSLKQRIKLWRAGQIEFLRDLVWCQDLIEQNRQRLLNDKDGVYSNIMAQKRGNIMAAIATKQVSLGAASNILIVSNQSVKDYVRKHGQSIDDPKVRARIFDETYAMIMVVVDTEWNKATFYIRGNAQGAEWRYSDLKRSEKGNNDLTELFKAMKDGFASGI